MKEILIIGNSKLANNLKLYLKKKKIGCKLIAARKIDDYIEKINDYKVILIATKDDFIEKIYKKIKKHISKDKSIFHFSGALHIKNIISIHPIFSFKNKTLNPRYFEKIIFTSENPRYVKTKLKWFKNKIIRIEYDKKGLYHALLSIYLNFPLIIKSVLEKNISKKFKIPENYLKKIFLENIKNDQITGPIIRNDKKVIKLHLKSIQKTDYYPLYLSVLKIWRNNEDI